VRRHSPLAQLPEGTLEFVPEGCPATGRASLFVIGDSHATAYLPLLEQMSAEQGRGVKVLQAPGCGYADLMQPLTPAAGHCHRMATAAMRKVLAEGRPGDIVFLPSLRLPRLILLGGEKRAVGSGDVFARTPQELQGIRAAAEDASAWTAPFAAAGLQVLIEAPKPLWRAHPFACVDWFNRTNPDCAGGLSEQRADLERYRAPVMRTLQELTRRHAGLQVWDPMDTLCDGGRCAALRDGRPLYFDGDHLSPYGNLLLWPSLRQAVNRLDPP